MKRLLLLLALTVSVTVANAQVVVEQMLPTIYDQGKPFKNRCPEGCVAGCGPIAMAQILYHYKAPFGSVGASSYTYGGKTVETDLNGIVFDWDNIRAAYPDESDDSRQAKAVADLVYACGAAMHISYGSSSSVNNWMMMLYGLQHNLHLSVDSRYLRREYYSTAEWIEMINQQLTDGHPVFYRGTWYFDNVPSDHMFVIDGVNAEGKYHVNFGNSGKGDKYADLSYLNVSGTNPGNRGVCYNAQQAMVINAFPTPDFDAYPMQASINVRPIVLNKDTMLHQMEVRLGESFSLSCLLGNCSDTKATGHYGWALIGEQGFINMLTSIPLNGQQPGHSFSNVRHLDVSLPTTLQDGSYALQLYVKTGNDATWREVWANAPTTVEVKVRKGKATVTVPDNHLGDPMLYLKKDITEVDNIFKNIAKGRVFALEMVNPTTNNFQNLIRLDIVADGKKYTYESKQAVYSQTQPTFHILVPEAKINLEGKNITSIRAYYYHALENRYIEMGESYAAAPQRMTAGHGIGDIRIYHSNGMLIKTVKACDIETTYHQILNALPHGTYIIVENNSVRKLRR